MCDVALGVFDEDSVNTWLSKSDGHKIINVCLLTPIQCSHTCTSVVQCECMQLMWVKESSICVFVYMCVSAFGCACICVCFGASTKDYYEPKWDSWVTCLANKEELIR